MSLARWRDSTAPTQGVQPLPACRVRTASRAGHLLPEVQPPDAAGSGLCSTTPAGPRVPTGERARSQAVALGDVRAPGRQAGVHQLPRKHHRSEGSRVGVWGSPCATSRCRGSGVRLRPARGQQAKAERCPCLRPPTQEPESQRQLGALARDSGPISKSPTCPPLSWTGSHLSQPSERTLSLPGGPTSSLCCCPRSATQVLSPSPCLQLRLLPPRPPNGSPDDQQALWPVRSPLPQPLPPPYRSPGFSHPQ